MKHHPSKYLVDMLDACHYLIALTVGKTVDDYRRDR